MNPKFKSYNATFECCGNFLTAEVPPGSLRLTSFQEVELRGPVGALAVVDALQVAAVLVWTHVHRQGVSSVRLQRFQIFFKKGISVRSGFSQIGVCRRHKQKVVPHLGSPASWSCPCCDRTCTQLPVRAPSTLQNSRRTFPSDRPSRKW